MSKETFLNQLSNELKISKLMLLKYIAMVGTNKENIINYAQNSSCAIVRKDNGFNINYTAKMLNDKDHKIAVLERALELACETFCSGSHPEMRFEIEKFTLIKGVQNYFKAKAESDIKNEKE